MLRQIGRWLIWEGQFTKHDGIGGSLNEDLKKGFGCPNGIASVSNGIADVCSGSGPNSGFTALFAGLSMVRSEGPAVEHRVDLAPMYAELCSPEAGSAPDDWILSR
jgi:hypothetical protein